MKHFSQEVGNDINLEQSRYPDYNPNPVITINIDGSIKYCNKASWELIGKRHKTESEKIPDFFLKKILEHVRRNEVKTPRLEIEINGKYFLFSIAFFSNTNSINLYGIDISERKEIERKIKGLSKFPSENPHPILRINYQCELIYYNKGAEVFLKKNFHAGYELSKEIENVVKESIAHQKPMNHEFLIDSKVFLLNIIPIPNQKYVNVYGTDITKQKHIEINLIKQRKRLSTTINAIGDGVISTDSDAIITIINPTAQRLTGFKEHEAIGKPITDIFNIYTELNNTLVENPVLTAIRTKFEVTISNPVILKDRYNQDYFIKTNCNPILSEGELLGIVLIFKNITNTLILEREIIKSQKLESIGILAGGIAHDFNNILTSILGNITLARLMIESNSEVTELLEEGEEGIQKAKGITNQLLTFTKGNAPIRKSVDLAKIIEQSMKFTLRGSNVTYALNTPKKISRVDVDTNQMSQVIQNLTLNSMQAMPNGGNIDVTIEKTKVKSNSVIPLKRGIYYKITFSDEGVGIPESMLSKVFDPYFTTKKKGNGLGLTMSYSIMLHHEGFMTIDSKENEGTDVRLYLPAKYSHDVQENLETSECSDARYKILIVEDDFGIINIYKRFFKKIGFSFKIYQDGEIALLDYKSTFESKKPYDLVITDLTMPGFIGGEALITKLREFDNKAKVVIVSGYFDSLLRIIEKIPNIKYLQKPFTLQELQNIIQATYEMEL